MSTRELYPDATEYVTATVVHKIPEHVDIGTYQPFDADTLVLQIGRDGAWRATDIVSATSIDAEARTATAVVRTLVEAGTLAPDNYAIRAKIADTPETPIVSAGQLTVRR